MSVDINRNTTTSFPVLVVIKNGYNLISQSLAFVELSSQVTTVDNLTNHDDTACYWLLMPNFPLISSDGLQEQRHN